MVEIIVRLASIVPDYIIPLEISQLQNIVTKILKFLLSECKALVFQTKIVCYKNYCGNKRLVLGCLWCKQKSWPGKLGKTKLERGKV